MKDKADAIIKERMKPKLSYYINPLWVKVMIIILLLLLILAIDGIFE